MPIVKTARALRTMPTGAVIEVLATDPGCIADFGASSRTTAKSSSSRRRIERWITSSCAGRAEPRPDARAVTSRPAGASHALATAILLTARAIAVALTGAWLERAVHGAEARAGGRSRDLGAPPEAGTGRRVRFLVMNAWGVGGTIRATTTTASHLASNNDVKIVSVLRTTRAPGMRVADNVRLQALFDRTDRRPSPRNLAKVLLHRAPSRLWDRRDRNYARTSLWTDVLLLRWLRSLPDGTVLVATRPPLVFLASRLAPAGVIVIAQEHQQLGRYRNDLLDDLVAALDNVSIVVTLTEADRDAYRDLLGVHGARVVAIPNAVPDVPLGPGDPAAHALIAAGRLAPQKGFDLLLEAFAVVAGKHPDWTLDIFGKGILLAPLAQKVADLGLGRQVRLRGSTDRLGERMRDASVYVLSSRYEGFPIVLLEALAAGLAVVSFDCETGPGEILSDGTDGLLVPAEDVPALAAALDRVMADESLRRRLAAAAPVAANRYSLQQVGPRWDALLAGR